MCEKDTEILMQSCGKSITSITSRDSYLWPVNIKVALSFTITMMIAAMSHFRNFCNQNVW